MARGTYKTGAKRDRRKADPGGIPDPAVLVFANAYTLDVATPGQFEVTMTLYSTGDATIVVADDLKLTGIASTAQLYDSSGNKKTFDLVITKNGNNIVYTFTNVAAGNTFFVGPAFDPAVRGQLGEWLAPSLIGGAVS